MAPFGTVLFFGAVMLLCENTYFSPSENAKEAGFVGNIIYMGLRRQGNRGSKPPGYGVMQKPA